MRLVVVLVKCVLGWGLSEVMIVWVCVYLVMLRLSAAVTCLVCLLSRLTRLVIRCWVSVRFGAAIGTLVSRVLRYLVSAWVLTLAGLSVSSRWCMFLTCVLVRLGTLSVLWTSFGLLCRQLLLLRVLIRVVVTVRLFLCRLRYVIRD